MTQYLMPRGSNPPTVPKDPEKWDTTEHYIAQWVAAGEVPPARRLSDVRFDVFDKGSRMLGWLVRHAADESTPPRHKIDGSLGAEIAFAFLLQRHVFRPGDSPRTPYDALMLQERDQGLPRFQVLVRYPTQEEKDDEAADRYIFSRGELAGKISLVRR